MLRVNQFFDWFLASLGSQDFHSGHLFSLKKSFYAARVVSVVVIVVTVVAVAVVAVAVVAVAVVAVIDVVVVSIVIDVV